MLTHYYMTFFLYPTHPYCPVVPKYKASQVGRTLCGWEIRQDSNNYSYIVSNLEKNREWVTSSILTIEIYTGYLDVLTVNGNRYILPLITSRPNAATKLWMF